MLKSVASPLLHFFGAAFPLNYSGQEPKNRHATPSLQIRVLRRPFYSSPPALARQHAQKGASPNGGELSYTSSNDKTTASPRSDLRQRKQQLSLLSTLSSPLCLPSISPRAGKQFHPPLASIPRQTVPTPNPGCTLPLKDYRSANDCSILTPNSWVRIFPVGAVTPICSTFISQPHNAFPVPAASHQRRE